MFIGERVRLDALLPEHFAMLQEWENAPEIQRLADDSAIRPRTPAQRDDFYRRLQKDNLYAFAIFRLADDQLIGSCLLYHVDPRSRNATLSIVISAPGAAGQGCGPDALQLMVAYAFDELNLIRLELEVFSFNTAAIRAYEKVGFQTEVVKREALFREGRYHDVLLMGLLRSEWADRSEN